MFVKARLLQIYVVVVLGILSVFANPAKAGTLSATASVTTPNYMGGCPAAIEFKGVISGPASTPVWYNFVYYDPQTKTNVTLPAKFVSVPFTGIIQVSTSIVVTAAQAGSSWVQLKLKSTQS